MLGFPPNSATAHTPLLVMEMADLPARWGTGIPCHKVLSKSVLCRQNIGNWSVSMSDHWSWAQPKLAKVKDTK